MVIWLKLWFRKVLAETMPEIIVADAGGAEIKGLRPTRRSENTKSMYDRLMDFDENHQKHTRSAQYYLLRQILQEIEYIIYPKWLVILYIVFQF